MPKSQKSKKLAVSKKSANAAKPTTPKKSDADAKPTTPTKSEKPQPIQHDIPTSYSGASNCFTTRKSRTAIQTDKYNTQPDLIFTARQNAFMQALKAKYADKPFKRLNADAGQLSRAIRAGHIQHVNGDPASLDATYQLTKKAIETKYN